MDNRVDHANPYTNQIFQEAVIRNDTAIVKLLLKYGIYPKRNERNRQGLTALQQCVLDGNGRMAILLLESGADIEAKTSNGWTSLHIASALGDLDMLATLVNHCCDLVALTKNEELPIDLAASRDIKIKLAKEMSRVGYSELAQWYMRKLAAREGVFYVLSTDTLLDLACDDKQERDYGNDYYIRQYNNKQRELYLQSPVRKQQQQEATPFRLEASPKRDMWLEYSSKDQPTYLTYSSGYISEVVFDPDSGQYSKALTAQPLPTTDSPQRKQVIEEKISLKSISEVDGAPTPHEETKSRNGTLKRTSSNKRHSQNIPRKQSTIEINIDYSHTTEEESDEMDSAFMDNIPENHFSSGNNAPPFDPHQSATLNRKRNPSNNYDGSSPGHQSKTLDRISTRTSDSSRSTLDDLQRSSETVIIRDTGTTSSRSLPAPLNVNEIPAAEIIEAANASAKNRNVKFDPGDTSNEFCNCPNCKKLGYAFSPDIQVGSRKNFHMSTKVSDVLPPMVGYNQFYYPETTTEKGALYFDQGYGDYKPRKRKKKLFSGIKSMFKDSIKVRTNMDYSPACDDAGILFSVSLRDRNKTKQIRQRQDVRRSNSFSGMETSFDRSFGEEVEEVTVLPHSQVVAPPLKFADIYQERDVIETDDYSSKMESARSAAIEYQHIMSQQNTQQITSHSQHPIQKQLQQKQQRIESQQAIHPSMSRNTYERKENVQPREVYNGNGLLPGEIIHYPHENISNYHDPNTIPQGYHYSRSQSHQGYHQQQKQQKSHRGGTSHGSPKMERRHHSRQQSCDIEEFPEVHSSKMSNDQTSRDYNIDRNVPIATVKDTVGKSDNCEFCKTNNSAIMAASLPVVSTNIE